jgi:hypothetical protein
MTQSQLDERVPIDARELAPPSALAVHSAQGRGKPLTPRATSRSPRRLRERCTYESRTSAPPSKAPKYRQQFAAKASIDVPEHLDRHLVHASQRGGAAAAYLAVVGSQAVAVAEAVVVAVVGWATRPASANRVAIVSATNAASGPWPPIKPDARRVWKGRPMK